MPQPTTTETRDWHKHFAASCFNACWDLLDKPVRTPAEEQKMLALTHASRCHWDEIGGPQEFSIGDWQIARVYAVLGNPELAVRYGQSALQWAKEHDLPPFCVAYGHEAIARGLALTADTQGVAAHVAAAREVAETITDEGTRKAVLDDLQTIPGQKA